MSHTESALIDAWNAVDRFDDGTLHLHTKGPLQWYVGYHTRNAKEVAVISNYSAEDLESSKGIITSCNLRSDGRYYISFQLAEEAEKSVFISMCSDMIDYSSKASDEKTALKKVVYRYKQWRRLMAKTNKGLLSDEKRKGLIGELLFLKEQLEAGMAPEKALDGWVGPEGADQDFIYNEVWYEVKTTGAASDAVNIHSFEQLGNKESRGVMRVYRVDPCAPETKDAIVLPELVGSIERLIRVDPSEIERFTVKLNEVGYIDLDEYKKLTYKFSSYADYDVNESFPRLVREDAPSQVINCTYLLSLPAIDTWKRG